MTTGNDCGSRQNMSFSHWASGVLCLHRGAPHEGRGIERPRQKRWLLGLAMQFPQKVNKYEHPKVPTLASAHKNLPKKAEFGGCSPPLMWEM